MISFNIERVAERPDGKVDVHVRYDGGGEIFTFPKSYPNTTILAALRLEFRRRETEGGAAERERKSLIGRHDV